MCFQLPPPSTQHICSNAIWQTVMTKSLPLPVKWRSQALLVIHMHRFRLIVQVFNLHLSCFMQSRDFFSWKLLSYTHPAPSPQQTASIRPTPGLREEQAACAVLHEACLLFTFALISCSLSHHGAGDPRQHSRYLGEQCWVFRISVYTEKTFRSAFSSPRFQTQSLVGKKRGIRWSPIFCRLNQISTIELLREWTSGVRGECS